MSRNLLIPTAIAAAAFAFPSLSQAEVPHVVADIAPVHSLVARVMEGVGTPELIVRPGASPHAYHLRPSEAGALERADVVFWVGEPLTPWMTDALGTLAEGAEVVTLLDLVGTMRLANRDEAAFAADVAVESDHEDHAGDDAGHNDHDHDEPDHDHAEGGTDPHAWLSTANAVVWLDDIAEVLSAADPENAVLYGANAEAARAEIMALRGQIADRLAPVRGSGYVVFHDAYQYFEADFGLSARGALALSDAREPGPARVAAIRAQIEAEGIGCVLSEPQFATSLVTVVTEGTGASTAVLDPLGADLEPGPGLYPALIAGLGDALAGCL